MSSPSPIRKPRRAPRCPPKAGQRAFDLVHKLLTGAAALAMLIRALLG